MRERETETDFSVAATHLPCSISQIPPGFPSENALQFICHPLQKVDLDAFLGQTWLGCSGRCTPSPPPRVSERGRWCTALPAWNRIQTGRGQDNRQDKAGCSRNKAKSSAGGVEGGRGRLSGWLSYEVRNPVLCCKHVLTQRD